MVKLSDLSSNEIKEYKDIQKIVKGSPIKVRRTNLYTSNATLSGGGFNSFTSQLGIGRLKEVAKAQVIVLKKRKLAKSKK